MVVFSTLEAEGGGGGGGEVKSKDRERDTHTYIHTDMLNSQKNTIPGFSCLYMYTRISVDPPLLSINMTLSTQWDRPYDSLLTFRNAANIRLLPLPMQRHY